MNSFISVDSNYRDLGTQYKTISCSSSFVLDSSVYRWLDLTKLSEDMEKQLLDLINNKNIEYYWTLDYVRERLMYRTKKVFVLGMFKNDKLAKIIMGFENNKQIWNKIHKSIDIIIYSSSNLFFNVYINEMVKLGYNIFSTVCDIKKCKKTSYYILPIHNSLIKDGLNIGAVIKSLTVEPVHIDKKLIVSQFDPNDFIVTRENISKLKVQKITKETFDKVYQLYSAESNTYPVFDILTKDELYDQMFNNKYLFTYIFYSGNVVVDFICCDITSITYRKNKNSKEIRYPTAVMSWHSSFNYSLFTLVMEANIMLAKEGIRFVCVNSNMNYDTLVDTMKFRQLKSRDNECFFNVNMNKLLDNQSTVRLPVKILL